jgi:hypothetical protein
MTDPQRKKAEYRRIYSELRGLSAIKEEHHGNDHTVEDFNFDPDGHRRICSGIDSGIYDDPEKCEPRLDNG